MLPRSLLSASTLKVENNEGGSEGLFSSRSSNSTYSLDHSQHETSSSMRSNAYQLSSDSSEDEEEGSVVRRENNMIKIPDVIAQLKRKLDKEMLKQHKYQRKLSSSSLSIKEISEQIAYYASLLSDVPSSFPKAIDSTSVVSSRPQMGKRSAPLPPINSQNEPVKRSRMEATKKKAIEQAQPYPSRNLRALEIQWASKRTMDVYAVRGRWSRIEFTKKPRSLLYNICPDDSNKQMANLMIATSLEGEVQFWNAGERRKIKQIGKDHLYDTWIEDMCWVNPRVLAIAPSPPTRSKEPGAEIVKEPIKMIEIVDATYNDVKGKVHVLAESPHENGVNMMGSVIRPNNNDGRYQFVTGGLDKTAYLWTVKKDVGDPSFTVESMDRMPIMHTSALTASCYSSFNDLMVIGGADERLSIVDLNRNSVNRTTRHPGKISQLLQSSLNPNIILITRAIYNDQFQIYDLREPEHQAIKLKFGQSEKENFSRYVKADMHKNGYMVACGGQDMAKVNFWDLRYCNVGHAPSFSMDIQSTPRVLVSMFVPGQDTVITASSTRFMTWLDYTVRENEIVKEFD